MSSRLTFSGLDEFRAELLALPKELQAEGAARVNAATERAAGVIRAAYPERTGELAGGVTYSVRETPFGAVGTIANTTWYARLYDIGTQARHTKFGADRGPMPAGKVFSTIIPRARRALDAELRELVEAHGLVVTGS